MIETLGQQLSRPHPKLPELIGGGILPEGCKAALFGLFKAGKTTLVTYTAMCVAGGLPLFGKYQTKQSRVLYIQMEMPHMAWLNRLSDCVLSKSPMVRDNLFICTQSIMKLDKDVSWLDRAVDEVAPELVVIDPYYKAITSEEFEVIVKFCDYMDELMLRKNFALIITTQGRKSIISNSGAAVDMGNQELRGPVNIPGWVDSIIGLRAKQGTKRRLTLTLRHGTQEYLDFTVDLDKNTWTYSIV